MFFSFYRLAPDHQQRVDALYKQRDNLREAALPDRSAEMKLSRQIKHLESRVLFDPTVPSNWLIAVVGLLAIALLFWIIVWLAPQPPL